ncbi:MAG TPA: N,N-dimethylformamidase beta subunit family domain-containing protein [Nitrososphaeraceae archaeon]|jgi:aspartate carbamoyltransferase regulatory subunit|nr:N,N-dimethylformamidase beta subunit family domain-containing protein [Nitrososphaeraceae archaeon]
MLPPRHHKSQLISITITVVLALIITNAVVRPPVNYGTVFQSSADINNKSTTIIPITSNNNDNYAGSSNRKVTEELSTANTSPSSFVVVQKRNIGRALDNNSASGNTSNNDNLTKSTVVLNTNRTYYRYTNTKSKNQIANLENNINSDKNSNIGGILNKNINIALVAPTFTAAAYDDNSFYTFYKLYGNTSVGTNVTSNLNLLSRHITNHDILRASIVMLKLVDNLKLINPNSHVTILTDADVDNNSLFNNNNNNIYDVAILGHQEYVTQQEYDNMKKFVTNGGTMILLDGNVFFAEVKYNPQTKTESLVKGHWWAFNGKSAWRSIGERWAQETSQWVGSNYLCYRCVNAFGNDPFEYTPHEEQYISNHNDSILLDYDAVLGKTKIDNKQPTIATYELNYQKGKVVALGIFSDDVIDNATFNKFFDRLLTKYARNTGI